MKLTPAASARSIMANAVVSSAAMPCIIDFSSGSPKVMAPRHSVETLRPLDPRLRYSMLSLLRVNQISVRQLHEMRQRGESIYLVDVRQPWEHELARLGNEVLVPLDQLADRADEITPP